MEEKWIDVIDYESKYEASNFGRVKSKPRIKIRKNGRKLTVKGKLLSFQTNKDGYYTVELHDEDGKNLPHLVHKIVWESFNGKVPDGLEIGHDDENNQNNRLDNLYLCTHPKNCEKPLFRKRRSEAMKGNSISKGLISKRRKAIVSTTIDGKFVKEYSSIADCKNDGYSVGNVSQCCNNKYLKEGNNIYKDLKWYFKDDYTIIAPTTLI